MALFEDFSSPGLSFNIIGFHVNFLIWTFFEHHSIHVHLSPLWWKQHPLKTLVFLNLEPNHEIVKSPQAFSTYVLLQGMLSSDELRGAEQAVPWSQRDSPPLPSPSLTLSTIGEMDFLRTEAGPEIERLWLTMSKGLFFQTEAHRALIYFHLTCFET